MIDHVSASKPGAEGTADLRGWRRLFVDNLRKSAVPSVVSLAETAFNAPKSSLSASVTISEFGKGHAGL